MTKIEFIAEVKKVTSKKLASLDMEYRAEIASQDLTLYQLGTLDADQLIKVTVEVING